MSGGEQAIRHEDLLAQMGWVEGLARALVRDESAAADVVQDTWTLALERPPRRARNGPVLRAWLAKVVRGKARGGRLSEARRTRRERAVSVDEAQPSTLDVVARGDMRRRVIDAVMTLDEPYRSTILYRYLDGLSVAKIARQQDLSAAAVRKRLSRGLAQLRGRLDREYGGERHAWCTALATAFAAGGGSRWIDLAFLPKLLGGLVVTHTKIAVGAAVLTALTYLTWQALEPRLSDEGMRTREHRLSQRVPAVEPRVGESPRKAIAVPAEHTRPLVAGAAAESIDVAPPAIPTDPADIVVYGQVRDPQGQPVSTGRWGRVVFQDEGTTRLSTALRGGAIFAVSGLRPGRWSVETDLAGFKPSALEIVLAADEPTVRLDLVVQPAVVLPIRIVSPNGLALQEPPGKSGGRWAVSFSAIATREAPEGDLPEMLSAVYTRYGIGVLRGIIDGIVTGYALPAGYLGRLELHEDLPAFVSLLFRHVVLDTQWVEAGSQEVVFRIPAQRLRDFLGSVRLKVVDATSGLPLGRARVALTDSQVAGGGQVVSDDGSALLEEQPPGLLELEITASGYEWFRQLVRVEPGQTQDLGVIALHRARRVTGRVLDEQGSPVSVRLSWFPFDRWETAQRVYSIGDQSDTDGRFELTGLGWGEHVIHASRDDWAAVPMVVDTTARDVEGLLIRVQHATEVVLDAPAGFRPAVDLSVVTASGLPVYAHDLWQGSDRFRLRLVPGRYVLRLSRSGTPFRSIPFQVGRDEVVLKLAD